MLSNLEYIQLGREEENSVFSYKELETNYDDHYCHFIHSFNIFQYLLGERHCMNMNKTLFICWGNVILNI